MGPIVNPSGWAPGWMDIENNARHVSSNAWDINLVETTPVTEPVTLAVAKAHLRVDFTDDDTLITALLTSCRQAIEQYCNLSIVLKSAVLTMDLLHGIEIPYGPIQGITSFVDALGNPITNDVYQLTGVKFQRIAIPGFQYWNCVLSYNTGYDGVTFVLEQALVLAILQEIAFRYENRGDAADSRKSVNPGICEAARIIAEPFRRYAWV